MKKFLLFVAGVVVCLLMANLAWIYLVGGSLREYLKPYLGQKQVRFLVLGDSHTARAWDEAEKSAPILNLSMGSDNVVDMANKYRFAKNKLMAGSTIFLTADPHVFSAYREELNNNHASALSNTSLPLSFYYHLPLFTDYKTSLNLKQRLLKLSRKIEKDTIVTKVDSARVRARFRQQFPSGKMSVSLAKEYASLIEKIKADGFRVQLMRYPVLPYYAALAHQSTSYGELKSSVDSITSLYDLQALNFDTAFAGNNSLFKDQDHLNRSGSRKFLGLLQATTGWQLTKK